MIDVQELYWSFKYKDQELYQLSCIQMTKIYWIELVWMKQILNGDQVKAFNEMYFCQYISVLFSMQWYAIKRVHLNEYYKSVTVIKNTTISLYFILDERHIFLIEYCLKE
jgi:hypothetical protein